MYKNNKTGSFADTKLTENYVKMTPEEVEWLEKYNGKGFVLTEEGFNINPDYPKELEKAETQARIDEIKAELIELDSKTIRPLRAGETEKLQELETQAEELRKELQKLERENNGD